MTNQTVAQVSTGPWHQGVGSWNYIYDTNGRGVASVDRWNGDMSEQQAIARLIAAAPELLAALIQLTAEHDSAPDAYDSFTWFGIVRPALEKALGEAAVAS